MVFTGATEDAEARSVIAGAKPACIGGTGTSRELNREAGEDRVEPVEALVGGLLFRAAEPDEDDVPAVALVGDPGLAL